MVELLHGPHQEDPRVVNLEVGLHLGCPSSDHRSPRVVELLMVFHHGSPRVVKLEIGLCQGCFIRDQEVSWGGKAIDGASPPKMQEGEVHDGTLP